LLTDTPTILNVFIYFADVKNIHLGVSRNPTRDPRSALEYFYSFPQQSSALKMLCWKLRPYHTKNYPTCLGIS